MYRTYKDLEETARNSNASTVLISPAFFLNTHGENWAKRFQTRTSQIVGSHSYGRQMEESGIDNYAVEAKYSRKFSKKLKKRLNS